MDIFFIVIGVVIYIFGYVMGIICASRKRMDKDSNSNHVESFDTLEDVINREG